MTLTFCGCFPIKTGIIGVEVLFFIYNLYLGISVYIENFNRNVETDYFIPFEIICLRNILLLIVSIVMIVGVIKEKIYLILPSLAVEISVILAEYLNLIVYYNYRISLSWDYLLQMGFILGFYTYYWICVYLYCKYLKRIHSKALLLAL